MAAYRYTRVGGHEVRVGDRLFVDTIQGTGYGTVVSIKPGTAFDWNTEFALVPLHPNDEVPAMLFHVVPGGTVHICRRES